MLGHSPGLVADQKDQRDSTRTLVGGAGTSGCRRRRACERHVNVLRFNLGRFHGKSGFRWRRPALLTLCAVSPNSFPEIRSRRPWSCLMGLLREFIVFSEKPLWCLCWCHSRPGLVALRKRRMKALLS